MVTAHPKPKENNKTKTKNKIVEWNVCHSSIKKKERNAVGIYQRDKSSGKFVEIKNK